jgi:hypothetical protein
MPEFSKLRESNALPITLSCAAMSPASVQA